MKPVLLGALCMTQRAQHSSIGWISRLERCFGHCVSEVPTASPQPRGQGPGRPTRADQARGDSGGPRVKKTGSAPSRRL